MRHEGGGPRAGRPGEETWGGLFCSSCTAWMDVLMEEEERGAPRGLATCQGHAEEGAELGSEEGSGCKAGAQHSAPNQSHWSRNDTSHLVATVPTIPFPHMLSRQGAPNPAAHSHGSEILRVWSTAHSTMNTSDLV